MKFVFLLLTGCAFVQSFFVQAIDLNEYLNEKLQQSKKEFIKIHIQEISPVQESSYLIQWDRSWRMFPTGRHRPFTINTFEEIFILDGNRITMGLSRNETFLNVTLALHQIDEIGEHPTVKFVKSIAWRNTTIYLLVCYDLGLCSLHTRTRNDALRFRHTVGYRGNPVDAVFFTNADQLYLVIVNNADRFSVPSVIYRWSGTYMDVIGEVMTTGARSVIAFEHRQSTIIVFAQNDDKNPRVGPEVYEFKNGNIVRIQFLSATRPISVHHYVHGDFNFVLMINEIEPSSVLCWDGRELLYWFSLPEIGPHSLISIFRMDGNTFIIVAHRNMIQLYKFHSTSDWKLEDMKHFTDNEKIIDMAVSINENKMTVMLVINEGDVYWVERWEAEITSIPSRNKVDNTADETRKCLSDLIQVLQARMPTIKETEITSEFFLPSAKDLIISKPVRFDNLILQSSTVEEIKLATEGEDIMPPHHIQQALNGFDRDVDDILLEWQKTVNETASNVFSGKIIMDEAFLEEFKIDWMDVDYVSDENIRSKDAILPENEQQFTNPLRAERIVVHDLEIGSLCGIPFQYWTFRNNTTNLLTAANGPIEISDNTVILHSDLAVKKLMAKNLNGTIIDRLIKNLFVINHSQKIEGRITYKNLLKIANFTTQTLNYVPAHQFMTTMTNQTFGDFYVKILKIDNLYTETIKGVFVEQAARKSRKNVIKGKLNLANLYITELFVIDVNASLMKIFEDRSLQIYENVTISGDLHLRKATIGKTAALFVDNVPVNVNDMFDNLWTKSSRQIIAEEITFEKGLTIDRLDTKYLNNFKESDFLYTTMEEISSEFTNMHFSNFHVNETFFKDSHNTLLFHVGPERLTIQEELHVPILRTTDIITLTFNGINIDNIINNDKANFSETTKFPAVRAHRVLVDNLDIHLLNDREVHFENGLHVDKNYQGAMLNVSEFHVQRLQAERLNGIEISLLMRLKDLTNSDLSRINIDGDLTVQNLTINQINGQSTNNFLEELAQYNIVIRSKIKIGNLIVENITLESLHDQNFDTLATSILSRSREQTISGDFLIDIITSNNVTVNFINERNTSQLMWVNEQLTITKDIMFTDLFIESDTITSDLNGHNIYQLYDDLWDIPARKINSLKVNGNIFWDTPISFSPISISYLMENIVTEDADQVITGKVTFEKEVRAWSVNGPFDTTDKIRNIISDIVIDCGESIEISGRKVFGEDLIADSLTVNGNLGIPEINDINILEFNESVVRKNHESTIVGPLIFRNDVKIMKLFSNNATLNASIDAAVSFTDVLPDNVFFEDLAVLRNVHLSNFDGINFDDFVYNRITLSGNHSIFCDVKFNGLVTVTGNAIVRKINGIHSSEFIFNDVDEVQIISGVKTFEKSLIIEGDVIAPRINNIEMTKEYVEGVQNDEVTDIYGNRIFNMDARIKKMNSTGLINGMDLRTVVNDLKGKSNETVRNLEKYESVIERSIRYSSQVSETLRNIFFYLEMEENFAIPGSNVTNIDTLYLEGKTWLNLYSEQPGNFCGLPYDCLCPYQLMIEFPKIEQTRPRKSSEIVKNFRDPDNISFGIKVTMDVVSSSKKCTSIRAKEESTTISFMKYGIGDSEKISFTVDVSNETKGYWKDAKMFKYDGDVYVVLAIYYNTAQATHRTNSLLYKIDLTEGNLSLIQEISTDGAWSIEIFKIHQREVFLLIGCFSESSESSLFRFDPIMQKFEQLRTFASRSRYVKSLSQGNDYFVLLDNPDTKAMDIYKYNLTSRNFYNYQSIFHDRQVRGIDCFYAGDIGNSDAFVIVVTEGGRFYIYEYMFAGKFQIKLQHAMDGLRAMVPFYYKDRHYIFVGTYDNSAIFRIIKQGPH